MLPEFGGEKTKGKNFKLVYKNYISIWNVEFNLWICSMFPFGKLNLFFIN
jgi:hypothetical protein